MIETCKMINKELSELYINYTEIFLAEYSKYFKDNIPPRINEFGIINEEKFCMKPKILVVAKETNDWKDEDFINGILFRSWMKNIAENGFENKSHIKSHPNMWYNLGRWIALIQNPSLDIANLSNMKTEILKYIGTVAFTNINKARGYKSSRKEYDQISKLKVCGDILRKEIELINPDIILCCGTSDTIRYHINNINCNLTIYEMPHPGNRTSKIKMLKQLKNEIQASIM